MKLLASVLGLLLVVAAGFAIHLSREVAAERGRLDELEARLQQRRSGPGAGPSLSHQAGRTGTGDFTTESTTLAASGSTPTPDSGGNASEAARRTLTGLLASPESMARRRNLNLRAMRQVYADIEEALDMDTAEADHVLQILLDQADEVTAAMNAARSGSPGEEGNAQVGAVVAEVQRNHEVQLGELFGSRYSRWQGYRQVLPVWQERRDLRIVLEAAGTPMTIEQDRALIAALAREQRILVQDAGGPMFQHHTPERHQRLLAAVAPHLSVPQFESYRQMLERAATQGRAGGVAAAASGSQ